MNISVNGPKIFYTIPILGGINITEKQRKAALEMLEKNKK